MAKVHDEGYGHQGSIYIEPGKNHTKMGFPSALKQSVNVPGSHSHTGVGGEEQHETQYGDHLEGFGYNVDDGTQDEVLDLEHEHMHPHLEMHRDRDQMADCGMSDAEIKEGYACIGSPMNLHGDSEEMGKAVEKK